MLARRRILEAPGRRTHRHDRDPGVHHRRRRHRADPAHGHHAPLRLLRRVEHRRELHPARAASRRLEPSQRGGSGRERADPPPLPRFCALFVALIAISSLLALEAPGARGAPGEPDPRRPPGDDQARASSTARTARRCSPATGSARSRARPGTCAPIRPRALAAQTVGYSTIERSRTGLEKSMNDFLTGSNANLCTLVDRVARHADGLDPRGERRRHLRSTSRRSGSRCSSSPAGCGSVVALEPSTGQRARVRVARRPTTRTSSRTTSAA